MADILENEVGFPVGEEMQFNGLPTVEIIPKKDATGKVTDSGELVIRIPYIAATITSSGPKARMFSICNKVEGKVFNDITGAQVIFSVSPKEVVDLDNAPKQLKILIEGNGPKKNSSN